MDADAQTVLSDPCLGLSSTYPWPFMFATVATLLMFVIEFLLKKQYNWRANSIAAAAMEQQAGSGKEVEAADVETVSPSCCMTPIKPMHDWLCMFNDTVEGTFMRMLFGPLARRR